jgi:predicted NBD/HSP70 family sugar kinase
MASPSAFGSPGDVLRLIRDGHAATRGEVIAATGLSRSTITQRLGALLEAGLLIEGPGPEPSSAGRPPAALSFNERSGVVLAADLGAAHGRLAVCDLGGAALAEREEPMRIADGPEAVLGWVGTGFDALLEEAGAARDEVLAMGVGVPGPVDVERGRPVNPPIMPGWDDYPVADELAERFGTQVVLERDAQAMVVGEHRRHFPRTRNIVFVKVATGIGAGIISDGRGLQGLRGRAGDIGHIRAIRASDIVCTCGNVGCVGALASGSAIVRDLAAAGYDVSGCADVIELVRAGDAEATRHVREAGRLLGGALAALVSIVAPTLVVVGGDMAEASEPLIAGIRESVYQRSAPVATQDLRIITSRLGKRAGVVGAATLALEHILTPANVDRLLARRGLAGVTP